MKSPLDCIYEKLNNDNLHLIAISNIRNNYDRSLERWWTKKYRRPFKDFCDYTREELQIEMLEDYYEKYPVEADKFLRKVSADDEWDGSMPEGYEKNEKIQNVIKRNMIDLSRFQSDKVFTKEEEEELVDKIGKKNPKGNMNDLRVLSEGEFEDTF
jgi:hypothetical protein